MPLLDAFFAFAVPVGFLCVLVAVGARSYDRVYGIYRGEEGAARRDAINQRFRTNTGALVILAVFLLLWAVTVAGLVERWGAIFFTFVVAVLLLLPFLTVCAGVVMLYMFAVHGYARAKDR